MSTRNGRFGPQDGNCALYGCAGVVVVGLIGVVAFGFFVRSAFNQLKEQYTSTEHVELPAVQVSDTERDATIKRVDAWLDALETDEATTQLVLSEQDVNVLIKHHDDLEYLSGNVYVTIDDSTIEGDMSFPLDDIPGFSGRYFNGSATFDISLSNGRLEVYVIAASVLGESLPEEALARIRNENFAKELHNNPEHRESIESLESIEVTNGIITITPKGFAAPSDEAEVEEEVPAEV